MDIRRIKILLATAEYIIDCILHLFVGLNLNGIQHHHCILHLFVGLNLNGLQHHNWITFFDKCGVCDIRYEN